MTDADLIPLLKRIAEALERLTPSPPPAVDLNATDAFVWHADRNWLEPIHEVNRVELGLLHGIDRVRDILIDNTERFAAGFPANNVLLWGARGTGKSSLVKAAHYAINQKQPRALALVEIHREDVPSLPRLLALLRSSPRRCLLFCDDLSFDQHDASYKSLKAVLEGGVEGRPSNVVLYATSNRRHLMPRDMIENERSTAINPAEAVEERVSMSDRFGLWLGFHSLDQDTYQAMIVCTKGDAQSSLGGDHPSGLPSRPARSWMNCQATRPEREPRVIDHSLASAVSCSTGISSP